MPEVTAKLSFSVGLMCHACRLYFDISPAVIVSQPRGVLVDQSRCVLQPVAFHHKHPELNSIKEKN